jgi:DNA polymerase-3 subunit epsilon
MAMTGLRIHVGREFYRVVNPGVDVPALGVKIHKLRPDDVGRGMAPAQALKEFEEFSRGSVLVGHFMRVDLDLVTKELQTQPTRLAAPAVCTARVQQWIVRHRAQGELAGHEAEQLDLAALAHLYHLEVREAHHALDDAYLTAQLWQRMLARLEALGVRRLRQLLKIAEVK